jgi:hypothetical protein
MMSCRAGAEFTGGSKRQAIRQAYRGNLSTRNQGRMQGQLQGLFLDNLVAIDTHLPRKGFNGKRRGNRSGNCVSL